MATYFTAVRKPAPTPVVTPAPKTQVKQPSSIWEKMLTNNYQSSYKPYSQVLGDSIQSQEQIGPRLPDNSFSTTSQSQQNLNRYNSFISGGQAPSAGGNGGGNGGSGVVLNAPTSGNPDQNVDWEGLRQGYAIARGGIEAQGNQLDQTYNISRGDIEGDIASTQKLGEQQVQDSQRQYSDILANQVRTYQDVNRNRMGTFSSLGTLDSSEFGNQQARADQSLAEQRAMTENEQVRTTSTIRQQVNDYINKSKSELARLALQWQSGRQQVADALAMNNVEEASAIKSMTDQIQQRAQQITSTINDFVNQASLLKAQGNDVRLNIPNINGNEYAAKVAQQLASLPTYNLPTTGQLGQGYIGNKKKTYQDLLTQAI